MADFAAEEGEEGGAEADSLVCGSVGGFQGRGWDVHTEVLGEGEDDAVFEVGGCVGEEDGDHGGVDDVDGLDGETECVSGERLAMFQGWGFLRSRTW